MKSKMPIKMPVVVSAGGWGDTLPEWLLKEVDLERLITSTLDVVKPENEQEQVGDCEALAYLMTASLEAPFSSEWTRIYLYLSTQVMRRVRKVEVPEEIRVEELNEDERRMLGELRSFIFRRRGGKAKHSVIEAMKEVFMESKRKKGEKHV